jgi:transporter family protein
LFNGKTWFHLGLSSISTPLSWLCYFQALSVGPASRVAPFDELSVALVIVSGALLLGEGLTLGPCALCSWAQAIDRPCKPV